MTLIPRPRGRAGYNGPGYPTFDPQVLQQAEQQRIAAQTAREQAGIQARAAAAQAEREFKAEQESAKSKAQLDADIAKRMAAFNLETTRTNSAWNLAQSKLKSAKDKPTIEFEDKSNPEMVVKRKMTEDQFAKFQAQKKAEENAPKIEALQADRDALAKEIATSGPQGWMGSDRRVALEKLDSQLKALQPPADLMGSKDIVPPAPAAPAAPTPRGFIGSPGANTFLDIRNPDVIKATEGMNREQLNAYAIKLNNQGAAPAAPGNLLRSDSFPLVYNPAHGSFQMQPEPQTERGVPVEQPAPVAAAPQDLLSAPSFRPAVGDLRAGEGNIVAPVPEDAPMAPFRPDARPRIPNAHIEHLIQNPDTADQFDSKYGSGTADEILNR
jgi:hypothetical protein